MAELACKNTKVVHLPLYFIGVLHEKSSQYTLLDDAMYVPVPQERRRKRDGYLR